MNTSKNLSAVLYENGNILLEERPIPEPLLGEVLISMRSVGICGSDIHFWKNGRIGEFIVKEPMLLGHESSGVVTKLGPGVTHLKIGDRVAIEPGVPCRSCNFCKIGRYNLCPDVHFLATPPIHGSLAQFHVHAADFCYKLDDNVSFEEGALLEPLSVAVHACQRANVTLGQTVLICGAGPIGLVSMFTAKTRGAAKIIITDLSEHRLSVAKKLGADYTYLVDSTKDVKITANEIVSLGGGAPQVTIECTGVEKSIQMAIHATQTGGVLVVVGMGPPSINLPIMDALVREVDIKGIFRYANTYKTALSMITSGQIDVKPLITHRFKLSQTLEAFETAKSGADGAIKVIINCH